MTNRIKIPTNHSEIESNKHWNNLLNQLPKNRLGKKLLKQRGKLAWNFLETWLSKHAYLKERPTFEEGYRLALWYLVFQNLLQESKSFGYSPMQLDRATGIVSSTIKDWFEGNHKPHLIRSP